MPGSNLGTGTLYVVASGKALLMYAQVRLRRDEKEGEERVTKMEKFDNSICFHCQSLGISFSSVGRAMDSSPRGAGFKSRHGYVRAMP